VVFAKLIKLPMRTKIGFLTIGFLLLLPTSWAAASLFSPPPGGWTYIFNGDQDFAGDPGSGFSSLDGTWSHDNGSDEWDGSKIGGEFVSDIFGFGNAPGGVMTVTENGVTYLRIQVTGDPRDYGYPDPSNRKIYFGHDMSERGAGESVLDDGVSLTFRARIPTPGNTTAPLDPLHRDGQQAAGVQPYPEGGDGYVTSDGGKGNFVIRQASGGAIAFSLTVPDDTPGGNPTSNRANFAGLTMNEFNGNQISGQVNFGQGTRTNLVSFDPTEWHEFWIVLRKDPANVGTHQGYIYMNGSLTPQIFKITAGNGSDYSGFSYLAIGATATPQNAALDIDFVGYKLGAEFPPGAFDNLPPEVENIAPSSGTRYYPASAGLSFTVQTVSTNTLPESGFRLLLNGTDLSAGLVISGTGQDRSAQFNELLAEVEYEAEIIVSDQAGRSSTNKITFNTLTPPPLPVDLAFPLTAARTDSPGFIAKVVQANTFSGILPNTAARAEAQLAGTLPDPATGQPYLNDAFPGLNPDGTHNESLINWNQNGGGFGAEQGNFISPDFPDDPIPGIPGFDGHMDNIAAEILTYLELPAGPHLFGVNSDDGFVLYTGANPNDFFAIPLGRFDGGRGAANSYFMFTAPVAGLYPFRLVYYEGSGDASLEWFSVEGATHLPGDGPVEGEKILINDRSHPQGIKAWRAVTASAKPYVIAASPAPGASGVSVDTSIELTIQDGGTQVRTDAVQLLLNGQIAVANVTRTGSETRVVHAPLGSLQAESAHTVTLIFADAATPPNLRTNVFTFSTGQTTGEPSARIITSVTQTGGVEPTAKSTGDVFDHPNLGAGFTVPAFGEDVPAFTDRIHEWNGATAALPLPPYLAGKEYVMMANNSRGSADFQLDITVSRPALVYLLIDNRHGTPNSANTTPPEFTENSAWVTAEGWQPVTTGHNRAGDASLPDEVGVDESPVESGPGAGIDQYSSVYVRQVPAGTVRLFAPDNAGRNMYGVVVAEFTGDVGDQIEITNISRDGGTVVIEWAGGNPPYVVQRKSQVTDPAWISVATAAPPNQNRATIPMLGNIGIFRIAGGLGVDVISLSATLSGQAEVPAVETTATGFGLLSVEGDTVHFHFSYEGLSGPATAAHIHGPASPTENAPPVIDLQQFAQGGFGVSGTISGSVTATAGQKTALLGGNTYVNIHTAAHPGGEIRGQILAP
jgi:hypothetical protein